MSRADAEALALQLPSSRVAFDPHTSYWLGATRAAAILDVNVSRLNQLVAAGRVPFEVHADGRAHVPARADAHGCERTRGPVALGPDDLWAFAWARVETAYESQPVPSPSASKPCGSVPVTETGPSMSAQSRSGGYDGTQGA